MGPAVYVYEEEPGVVVVEAITAAGQTVCKFTRPASLLSDRDIARARQLLASLTRAASYLRLL